MVAVVAKAEIIHFISKTCKRSFSRPCSIKLHLFISIPQLSEIENDTNHKLVWKVKLLSKFATFSMCAKCETGQDLSSVQSVIITI